MSQEDPQRTVQTFIDLVQRHEQSFYTFVHNVHSKGQGLFDSLMLWIELFLSYARDGLPHPIDLEFILTHGAPERATIMKQVATVAQYHYRMKVAHEEKVRRRFNKESGPGNVEEAALLDSVMASLSLGQTAVGDAGELADEESEEEDEQGDEDDDESEGSSIQSGKVGDTQTETTEPTTRQPLIPLPTPELTVDPDLPFLSTPDARKDRRNSGGSGRMGIFHRKSPHPDDKEKDKHKDDQRPPPARAPRPHTGKSRRARQQLAAEMMVPPETKSIDALRPLFVEIVSGGHDQEEVLS